MPFWGFPNPLSLAKQTSIQTCEGIRQHCHTKLWVNSYILPEWQAVRDKKCTISLIIKACPQLIPLVAGDWLGWWWIRCVLAANTHWVKSASKALWLCFYSVNRPNQAKNTSWQLLLPCRFIFGGSGLNDGSNRSRY